MLRLSVKLISPTTYLLKWHLLNQQTKCFEIDIVHICHLKNNNCDERVTLDIQIFIT